MKKNGKKNGIDWKKLAVQSIVFTLFAALCILTTALDGDLDATVRLADPETEARLAGNREQLARQQAEIEKLKTENIQKTTENAQKIAEISNLKSALSRLKAEKKLLETESAAWRTRNTREKSGLLADITRLEEQNRNLRKELLDTLERSGRTEERLRRLEESAAGVLERLGPVYTGRREAELAGDLDLILKSGLKLVSRSSAVCELLLPKITGLGLSAVEEARLRVALEELAAQNRVFARLSLPPAPPEKFEKCRILEVVDNPGAVILNAGYRDGVRAHLQLQGGSGGKELMLRVVAVRPFISAAMPEDGSFRGLSAGMEVRAFRSKDKKKTGNGKR